MNDKNYFSKFTTTYIFLNNQWAPHSALYHEFEAEEKRMNQVDWHRMLTDEESWFMFKESQITKSLFIVAAAPYKKKHFHCALVACVCVCAVLNC